VLAEKMRRLSDTLRSVRQNGPEIILLPEVENQRVLQQFVQTELKDLGYRTVVVLEGDDERGIDVGLISKFPMLGEAKLHKIDFKSKPADFPEPSTRGILHVALELPSKETLHVLGVHFPSQSNPTWQRKDAVEMLNKIQSDLGPTALVMVGGDFNIAPEEEVANQYFAQTLSSQWAVSHLVGCKSCIGTYNFKNTWNFLDALLFSKSLMENSKFKLDTAAFATPHDGRYQKNPLAPNDLRKTYPAYFDPKSEHGVSDHFPIVGELNWRR
jgi:endonuclease/exonuclease/phosphatase family metal-dependent hydrolase